MTWAIAFARTVYGDTKQCTAKTVHLQYLLCFARTQTGWDKQAPAPKYSRNDPQALGICGTHLDRNGLGLNRELVQLAALVVRGHQGGFRWTSAGFRPADSPRQPIKPAGPTGLITDGSSPILTVKPPPNGRLPGQGACSVSLVRRGGLMYNGLVNQEDL